MAKPVKFNVILIKKRIIHIAKIRGLWRLPLLAFSLTAMIGIGFYVQSDSLVHISQGDSIETFNLSTHWAQGNVVALVRHAERCDHSDHLCLDGDTGITAIGKSIAIKLGENFEEFLPKEHTVFYNSPLKRTHQTAQFMFDGASTSQEWLHENCKAKLLEDILKNKKDGINMVLVTHSTCINNLHTSNNKKLVTIDTGTDKSYAVTVFLTISKTNRKAYVLGYLYPDDWKNLPNHLMRFAGSSRPTDKHLL